MKRILLILLIVSVGQQTAFSQCETPPTGMVSWWTGDMTTLDKIDDNHAIPFNGTSYAPGMVDEALLFDGIDDLAIVFPSPELDTTGDMTVMAWVRRIGYANESQTVFCKGAGYIPNDAPTVFALRFEFNVTEFLFEDNLGNNIIVNGPAFEDSMYHHYVYVRQGNWHGVYVDGFLFGNGTFVNPPASSAGLSFTLGAQYHNPTSGPNDYDFHFHGELDELMHNRALTVTEIQAIYNAGADGVCKDALSVAEHSQEVGVKVFPNPTSDYVQFQMDAKYLQQYPNAQLTIYDMKGATVRETALDFNSPINISNLKNGVYLYSIQSGNQVLDSGQLLKK
jgi:hypothetical protein